MRALLVPWGTSSLLFVGISSVLLTLSQSLRLLGWWIACALLLSWLFKYAYVLLEHVANGFLEPPTVSLEMLSPVEQRPAIQLAWCLAAYLLIGMLGGLAGTALGHADLARVARNHAARRDSSREASGKA